jgi:hypothetical protein
MAAIERSAEDRRPIRVWRRNETFLRGKGLAPIPGYEGAGLDKRVELGNPGVLMRRVFYNQAKTDGAIQQQLGEGIENEVVVYQADDESQEI